MTSKLREYLEITITNFKGLGIRPPWDYAGMLEELNRLELQKLVIKALCLELQCRDAGSAEDMPRADRLRQEANAVRAEIYKSVPRDFLVCLECGTRHYDLDTWGTRIHITHRCAHCGHEWDVDPPKFGG